MEITEQIVLEMARKHTANELLRIDGLAQRIGENVMKLIRRFAKKEAQDGIARMLGLQSPPTDLGGFTMMISTSDNRWTFDLTLLDTPVRFIGTAGSFEEAWARAREHRLSECGTKTGPVP
jgi:hypothetical protein